MYRSTSVQSAGLRLAVLAIISLWTIFPAQAQLPEFDRLIKETQSLYEQGRYDQAVPSATQAIRVAEDTFGPEHPIVAVGLIHRAKLYSAQGQYAQAESLLKRSVSIFEKALGPDHQGVASALNNLADLYRIQGQYAQAEPLFKRSLAIYEKTLGPDHLHVALGLNNLAVLYDSQGQYDKSEPLYVRSLAIKEKALGADHPEVALSLSNLALLYHSQGKSAQAEPLLQRSLTIYEKVLGSEHPQIALALSNLGALYQAQGKYAQAEPLCKRSLAIREKTLGPDHPDTAGGLNNLAGLYRTQGKHAQAEPLFKRSLAIYEKTLGPDHPSVALSLNNLAALYDDQGQYAQAEPLYKRSLAIKEKALGPDHPDVAVSLNNLADLYRIQGQYAQAEPLFKRSLVIMEKALGPDHPTVATNLNNLALLNFDQGKFAQSGPLFKQSLEIREKALGPEHPDVASTLNALAGLYFTQRQYTQAESLYKRSLEIREKALGPGHPDVAYGLNALALVYFVQGQFHQALTWVRRSSSIYRERIIAGGTADAAVREASKNRFGFLVHLSLLSRNPDHAPIDKNTEEAFQIVQLAQASGTASAIAKMASRFSKGDDALATLIKRKQDANDTLRKREAQLVTAVSKLPKDRSSDDEDRLRHDITLAGKEIETIDSELTLRFPEYQELTRPEPATVSQIRALLKPAEAMLVYALDNKDGFFWVVKPDGAVFVPLQVDIKDVAAKVATIRAEMEFDGSDQPKRVSVDILHELYQRLFAPATPHLAGVRHVMVVPSGPLQSLPFGMLIASPSQEITSNADYRQVNWLAKHYAFSVLPSVSSIQAFRQFAKAGVSQEPFAGFGDPLIGGSSSTTRGKRGKMDVAAVFRNLAVKTGTQPGTPEAEIADVEAIRKAPRLPETADELRAMGKVLNATPNSIWLQENATETKIKHLDLSKYRTIAFATHGLMAGEIKGVGESGLILTPPKEGTLEDDGYLSAGEIAKMKLNADWVVLSACNTAAADGTPGAEGLSGLAKAFFYAGARSLLVSHWPVASEATVPLTTGMLKEYEANPAQGKAEAHRKAMMTLMATSNHPEYAHPIFWAPFVVVGEGGAGRR
jgi:tetratricopeptide (TPR) repeat protein